MAPNPDGTMPYKSAVDCAMQVSSRGALGGAGKTQLWAGIQF